MNDNFSIVKLRRWHRGAKGAPLLDYQLAYLRGELEPEFPGKKFIIFAFYNLLDGKEALSCAPNVPGASRHPRDLWKTYGDDYLPEFIEKHPGCRPLPWWQWSAPDAAESYRALELAKARARWPARRQRKYLLEHGLLSEKE